MTNKLFVLIGKSGSGKDTVLEQLIHNYGYKKVISYTTRPMRDGEMDGINYHFVSDKVFKSMIETGEAIEYNTFETSQGYCYYGTHKDILKDLENSNLICIKEPKGTQQLINVLGSKNVIPIVLERDGKERIISSLKRGDNWLEVCRRGLADHEDFTEIDKESLFRVNNETISDTETIIHNYIQGEKYLFWTCEDNIAVGDKVRVINIRNKVDGKHLLNKVGLEGKVFTIIIKNGQKRYKVLFDNRETVYFRRSELELINDEKEGNVNNE